MSSFRFLDLPDELRLKMYRFMLPRGERIHLDPENVIFPIPYILDESYGCAFNLLQVCKKLHIEATQFIYQHNTVNTIATTDMGNFLEDLGVTACQYMTKLECHVLQGLVDLGSIWSTMMAGCPRLTDLRLVFYHEAFNWCRTLAQLAYYKQQHQDSGEDSNEMPKFDLDVELHTSIWARRFATLDPGEQFYLNLKEADRHARIYDYAIPLPLRHVTITASVNHNAMQGLMDWEDDGFQWEFTSVKEEDNGMTRTLRFQPIQG